MNRIALPEKLAGTYPSARVRGRLITRWESKILGWANLDAEMADEMGREQLGWFVGGHPGVKAPAIQLGRLDMNPDGGVWVVVPLGRELAHELLANWPHTDYVTKLVKPYKCAWRSRKVWVAVPEDLNRLLPQVRALEPGLAGVVILDPPCLMYRTRGGADSKGNVWCNDRPQHVVNFRAALDRSGWQPPILLLTERPAKAVTTEAVARSFCLNGFRFIQGDTFACWETPIDLD